MIQVQEHNTAVMGKTRFAYEYFEGTSSSATLFIHGNLASTVWWRPVLGALSKRTSDFSKNKLILADWRGCGRNRDTLNPEDPLNLAILAQDYICLLEYLKLQNVTIVAHSTGGLIALQAMQTRPDLFQGAVLIDSVSARGVQFSSDNYAVFRRMSQDKNFCEAIILGTIWSNDLSDRLRKEIVDAAYSVNPRIWHGIPNLLHSIDIRDQCRNINQPVLVLHGEYDTLLPRSGSEELATLLPRSTFRLIPNCGHCANVENPDLVIDLCESFFASF